MNKFAAKAPIVNNSARPVAGATARPQTAQAPLSTENAMPTHILKVKDGETLKTLTGLFTKTDKKGQSFLQGKDRESGNSYYIMSPRNDGDAYKLRIREGEQGNYSFTDVADLAVKNKNGSDFLTGGEYFVFEKESK